MSSKKANSLLSRLPAPRRDGTYVFGHRGARGLAPENTLSAFEMALSMGLDGVEMDVMLCASGEPVVFHDYRLATLAGGWGWIETTSLDELKKLDVGALFHPKYRGEKIPTLDEVLDLLGDRLIMNIELKGEDAGNDGIEMRVLEALRRKGLSGNIIISSFNPVHVARIKEVAPQLATGILVQRDAAWWLRRFWFKALKGADAVHAEIGMVSGPMVKVWRSMGKAVFAWPANTNADMNKLINAGADGIITDKPDRLLEFMGN